MQATNKGVWTLVKVTVGVSTRRPRAFKTYENEIFSNKVVRTRKLAGKRDSRRHSTTSFNEKVVVTGTSYKMLEVS